MTKVWLKVSFSCDCVGMNQDECSICGEEYTECPCPGPTQDEFEYKEISGVLYARAIDNEGEATE